MKYIYIFSKVSTKIPRKPNTGQVSSLSTISGTFHIYIDVGMSFSNSNTHNTIPSDLSKSRNASQRKQESNLFRCHTGHLRTGWLCVCVVVCVYIVSPQMGWSTKKNVCAGAHSLHIGFFLDLNLLDLNLVVDVVVIVVVCRGHDIVVVKSVGTTKNGRMSRNVEKDREDARCQNGAAHNDKGVSVFQLPKGQTKPHGTSVASGSDNSRNGPGGGWVNVGDNGVHGSLGGLDKDGEKDHDDNGRSECVGIGKDQNEGSLAGKAKSVKEESSAHAETDIEMIRRVSAQSARKQIHPSKDGGNGRGRFGGLVKLFLKVQSGRVVHGEFDAKAARVLDKENPRVEVECAGATGRRGRHLGHGPVLFHLGVVTLGRIVADKVHHNARRNGQDGRHDRHGPPSHFGVVVQKGFKEGKENGSHDELGDSTAQIAPSGHEGVGTAHHIAGKHAGGPVLAHDKGPPGNANKEPEDRESNGRVDQSGARCGNRGGAQNNGKEDTGSVLVARRSEDETHKDGSTDSENGRRPDLLFAQIQRLLNLGLKRSNGKPNEKGHKEGPPGAVKGTHVRTGEVTQLNLQSPVILLRIHVQDIGLVLFGLLGL